MTRGQLLEGSRGEGGGTSVTFVPGKDSTSVGVLVSHTPSPLTAGEAEDVETRVQNLCTQTKSLFPGFSKPTF